MVLGTSTASARDRTKPTAPKNFRVTAKTSYSISLAWSPSTDNSGNFTYRLWSTAAGASGGTVTLPKTATSFTWNTGILPRNTYTFGFYAVDAAGNTSPQVPHQAQVRWRLAAAAWVATANPGASARNLQQITATPYFSNRSSVVTTVKSWSLAVAMMKRSQGSLWIGGSWAAAMQTFKSSGWTASP